MLLTVLMALGGANGAWADDIYSQDYEGDVSVADLGWTTGTSGRFTPVILAEDTNHYLSVDQDKRNNNGTTVTSTEVAGKVDANTDFFMSFDLKIGSSNNQYPVSFTIKNGDGGTLFSLTATGTYATTWILNGSSTQVSMPGTDANKAIASLTWYSVQLIQADGKTFVTIKNKATGNAIIEDEVYTTSPNGGIGNMSFVSSRYNANFAIDNILIRNVESSEIPTTHQVTATFKDSEGTKLFEDIEKYVVDGKSFTPSCPTTYNSGFYTYSGISGNDAIASVTEDTDITVTYATKTLNDAYSSYNITLAQDYVAGSATQWTTGTSGRFTPVVLGDNNDYYLTVNQSQRNNNGTTITGITLKDLKDADTDFTLCFDMRLGSANNGTPVFTLYDKAGTNAVLKIASTGISATTWKINDNDEQIVTLDGSGYATTNTHTWYSYKLTRFGDITYLSINNKSTGAEILPKTIISQLSEDGGLGKMTFETSRNYANFAMDNILLRDMVKLEDLPLVETQYTVKFVKEDGTSIKDDVVADTYVYTELTATDEQIATFELNGKKYVYKEGNDAITAVADAESNVITLVFYEYSKWSYTVTTSYSGNTLPYEATGEVWEDDNKVYVQYPRFQLVGTQLVERAPRSNELNAQITVANDGYTTDFAYTAVNGKDNIYMLTEAEDLENTGLTKHNTGSNFPNRLSGGYLVYGSSANLFTLPAGKYIVTLGVIGARNSNSVTYNIYAADKDSQSDETKIGTGSNSGNYLTQISSDEFTLTAPTIISMTCSDPATTRGIDLVYVQKTGEYVPASLDITDFYITNPGFENGNTDGWTVGASSDTGARETTNDTYKMTNSEGSYLFNTWWQGIPITQTIKELPAGTYTLSSVVASDGATVYMISGDDTSEYAYTETTNSGIGISLSKTFTLTETSDFKIGVVGGANGEAGVHKEYVADGYWWYKADNFRLALVLEGDATIPAAIVAKLEEANPVNEGTVSTVAAAAYTQAKSTFESNATLANYEAYLAAVANYNKSVADYAAVEAGVVATNTADGWAISTKNGSLACNTWSTEGNSDGSNMTTPFVQDWVGQGTPLAGGEVGGKLYYRMQLTPGETYTVTALVRAFNEAGTGVTGATFFVGDDSKSIDELGAACTGDYASKGKFGTFSCTAEVGEDGVLEFGVALDAASPINWVAIKNVTIAESSGIKPTAIALNKTSATLTTGDAITLTATITPNDAEDQTIQWTSSNEAVATVSGGIVAAVGAGTATITAKAVAGNNVTATATITVTDAPALAYTTAISGTGKYLLRNVATGKYLNAANAWGTQASLADHGVLFTATLDDGAYKLTDFVTSSTGLGTDAYLDQTPIDVTVAAVNGKTNVYTLSLAEGTYLAGQAGSTVVTKDATDATSSLAQWQFISKDDMNKNMTTATAENPIDMTYFIMDPNFSRNNGYYSNWTFEASNKNNAGDNTNFCVESYHATFTMSQTLTVPNGTYRLRGQAFYRQDGSDNENLPYFFANDQKATFPERTGTENSMSAASTAFTNGLYYSDYATVTVTDHTLTVGAKLETNTTLWCIWDNISLEMIGYIPVTEIAATIDNAEFEVLETAQVTATTTPEVTSFGVTYSSSDESVATVDNTGKVTGVGPGTATITVAGEIETSVTATVDVTVTSVPLITEAVNLDFAQGPVITSHIRTYEKDKTDSDLAQMQAVTGWSFGVANGDAKAAGVMAYGSSYGMGSNSSSFYAPATNPSGEASGNALGMVGVWTAPVQYVQSVKIPAGAYVLTIPVYRNGGATALTKNLIGVILDNNTEYLATTTTYAANTWTTETIRFAVEEDTYGQLSIGFNAPNVGSDNSQRLWVDAINVEFEPFATENEIAALNNAIQEAEAKTLGFQKDEYAPYNNVAPLTSLTAAKSIDTSKSVGQSTVTNATTELTGANWVANTEEVNAIYDGTFASATNNGAPAGWTMSNNTLGGDYHSRAFVGEDRLSEFNSTNSALFIRFDNTNSTRGSMYYYGNTEGYTMPLKADTYYRVTVDFAGWGSTGKPLRMNVTGPDGFATVSDQYNTAHRADTESDYTPQQFNIVFRTAGAGNYVINFQTPGADTNTHNAVISNLRLFTEPESSATLVVTAAKYGTFIAPFEVTMPEGVIAYTVTDEGGSQLTLTSKATQGVVLPANTPVVVYSEEPVSETFQGYSLAVKDSYEDGSLVGTYTDIQAPDGSYILQNQNGRVGFYRVDTSKYQPMVRANRAYLSATSGARASFFFEDAILGIDAIELLTSGEAQVFDVNGVQQPRLKKGLNILRAKDGRTTKVMVK